MHEVEARARFAAHCLTQPYWFVDNFLHLAGVLRAMGMQQPEQAAWYILLDHFVNTQSGDGKVGVDRAVVSPTPLRPADRGDR